MLFHLARAAGCDSDSLGCNLAAVSFVAAVSLPMLSSDFSRDAFCGGALGIRPPTPELLPRYCHLSDVLTRPLAPPHQRADRELVVGRTTSQTSPLFALRWKKQ